MRSTVSMIMIGLALAGGCWLAAACSDDAGVTPVGSGGAGGSGVITDGGGDTGTVGCLSSPPTTCPNPPVTYAQVQPIFQARCVNVCHNGATPDPSDPSLTIWALSDYKHVSDWRDSVRSEISDCLMPPPDAGVPVTIEERTAIVEFIRCGLPQ